MTKVQKIWLGVFLAMFLVPEILWSPVVSFAYELMQKGDTHALRTNFLTNLQHYNLLLAVLFLEFWGVILSIFYIFKYSKFNTILKIFLCLSLAIFLLVTVVVLYLAFSFRNGINF